ncbi:hypothetical protein OV079_12335 [Nannocystis pusilla]|uniref:Uncharacterized protein n=1 Tax=Nannocystis pusilla TaxID=889268 RepID=A0A9X3ELN0_9BACT|nr:hypothetical protein [Nannocystis pusilla]MCY1006334.1 hypothetical protein [Nannocystis pusilla]
MWKKLAIVLLVLLLLAGGVVTYLWLQVTALPDWYTELAQEDAPAAVEDAGGKLQWQPAEGKAGRQELRNFHRKAARSAPEVKEVIKASRATFEDGQLEAGVVADLRKLPKDKMSGDQQGLFERARAAFPSLTERDVYIGVEDPSPVLKNGRVTMGPSARVKIGKFTYSLDGAAQKLGMTPDKLRAELEKHLRELGVEAPS